MFFYLWEGKLHGMKFHILIIFLTFSIGNFNAQERFLIKETAHIKLFETYLSNTSDGNIFPVVYNNGLLFLSNHRSKDYQLYFSNLQSELIKIRTNSKFNVGSFAVDGNEIYFTGATKRVGFDGNINSAIYKGTIEDLKVSKIEKVSICETNYSYAHPSISKEGDQMVLVTNENGIFHLLEFVKNNKNEWVKNGLIYISHPVFEILNPTIYNKNTVYFSTDIYEGQIKEIIYKKNDGTLKLSEIRREKGAFNIYKISRKNGHWGIPVKVPELNSDFDDLGVIFTAEKSGYLNTYRFNSTDNIYYFELK